MRHAIIIGILLLALGANCASAREVTESYDVTIDGKKFSVTGGAVTNLTVGDKKVAIGVERAKFKRFDDGKVSFLFPSDFSVEKDDDSGMTMWSLDGNSSVIMLYQLPKEIEADEFAENVVKDLMKTYGKGAKLEKCERQLGAKTVKGKRIEAKFAGESIVQEVYDISEGSAKYTLMIQDDPEKTEEAKLVGSKLKETFQIKSGK